MTKNNRIAFLIFLLLSNSGFAQDAFNWKNISSMKSIYSVVADAEIIWAATTGGVFSFNRQDSTYKILDKSNGLNGNSVSAIAIDKQGKIWLGSSSGAIDVYDPLTDKVSKVLDIANSNRSMKQINNFIVKGDTIAASTDFGVSLINSQTFNFYDTYFKFGSLPSNIKVNSCFYNGRFYIATMLGVAIQKSGAVNLSAPESWDVYSRSEGLPNGESYKVGVYHDSLIVSTSSGFYSLIGNRWSLYTSALSNKYIKDFSIMGDTIIALTEHYLGDIAVNEIHYLVGGADVYSILNVVSANSLSVTKPLSGTGTLQYVSTTEGVGLILGSTIKYYYPNGPQSNFFSDVSVAPNGDVWFASGTNTVDKGFYRLRNSVWKNYSYTNTPAMQTDAYHNVFAAPDNNVYIGSYGKGFTRIKFDNSVQTFYTNNSPLKGINSNPNYLVISGLRTDSKNNLWILNYESSDRKNLSVLTSDSTWFQFENSVDPTLSIYAGMTIDQSDTKWFFASGRTGIYFFNENNTLSNKTDDIYGFVNESYGLTSEKTQCAVADNRGDVWIGTSLGAEMITPANAVLQKSPNNKPRIIAIYPLRQQSVNALAVDAINRKWAGTNQGLFLVSEDGTNLLAAFDSKNSPLISDVVQRVAVNRKTGAVYVCQNGAISTFYTMALNPADSYSGLTSYPSPFISGKNTLLTIDGLMKSSEIKIFDISGGLIKAITTPGGRVAMWDGKDQTGNYVNSGVYLIISYQSDGKTVAKSKVAVVRQ